VPSATASQDGDINCSVMFKRFGTNCRLVASGMEKRSTQEDHSRP